MHYCTKELGITLPPKVGFIKDSLFVQNNASFAAYDPVNGKVVVYWMHRSLPDVLRSLAHELVHHRQNELGILKTDSGDTGSSEENEANALAGILMRDYGRLNPKIYEVSFFDDKNF